MSTLREIIEQTNFPAYGGPVDLFSVPVIAYAGDGLCSLRLSHSIEKTESCPLSVISRRPDGSFAKHARKDCLSSCLGNFMSTFRALFGVDSNAGLGGINIDPVVLNRWMEEVKVISRETLDFSMSDVFGVGRRLDSYEALASEIDRVNGIAEEVLAMESAWRELAPLNYYGADGSIDPSRVFDSDSMGNQVLHRCESDADLISELVRHGADVNARNRYGQTPLHRHISDERCIRSLVALGANPALRDQFGIVPLDLIGSDGPLSKFLYYATIERMRQDGELHNVRAHESAGVILNQSLAYDINHSNRSNIDSLLSEEFELRFPYDEKEMLDTHFPPICAAMDSMNLTVIKACMERNADQARKWIGKIFVWDDMITLERTKHNMEVLRYIAEHCDPIDRLDHLLAMLASPLSNVDVKAYLQRVNLDVNVPFYLDDRQLLLHSVVSSQLADRIALLFELGADPDQKDEHGRTAWDIAGNLPGKSSNAMIIALERGVLRKQKKPSIGQRSDALGL